MPVLAPSIRDYLRKLLDERKAARRRYLDLCIMYQRSDQNSPEGYVVRDACDAALDAWAASERRQEQAFIDAGVYKMP